MTKAMKAADTSGTKLEEPRIVSGGAMLVVGLSNPQSFNSQQNIPAQWQRFMAAYDDIPNKANPIPLGVSTNMDEDRNFEYLCGVEVSKVSAIPPGFTELRIPAQTYAVFAHRDHISKIGATYSAIWNSWLPDHKKTAADGASLERHMQTFDPRTGLGGVEIWIPVEER